MTPLPSKFTGRADQKGWQFTVLKRHGDVVLVGKSKNAGDHGWMLFEVVIVQKAPERVFPGGITVPAHEAMHGASVWGTYGWSFVDRTAAEKVYGTAIAHRAERPKRHFD